MIAKLDNTGLDMALAPQNSTLISYTVCMRKREVECTEVNLSDAREAIAHFRYLS